MSIIRRRQPLARALVFDAVERKEQEQEQEQECTAFLRAFFNTAIAAARTDTDTVTETGNTVRLET